MFISNVVSFALSLEPPSSKSSMYTWRFVLISITSVFSLLATDKKKIWGKNLFCLAEVLLQQTSLHLTPDSLQFISHLPRQHYHHQHHHYWHHHHHHYRLHHHHHQNHYEPYIIGSVDMKTMVSLKKGLTWCKQEIVGKVNVLTSCLSCKFIFRFIFSDSYFLTYWIMGQKKLTCWFTSCRPELQWERKLGHSWWEPGQ